VHAVARQFARCHVVADTPVLALAPVQKYREFSAMGPLVGHQRVSLKHGFEPPGDVTGLVPDACEMLQVAADLALVPGDQDGLNVGKVLIQRRPPDAGLRGDLRHRHRRQPMLGHQPRRSIQGRVAHRTAVLLDRIGPQLRHQTIVYAMTMAIRFVLL
jgi:hypothetical protein